MQLNEAMIPHYRAKRIPIKDLLNSLQINENLLRKKPNWYEIEGNLDYFKARSDFCLFTELFFSIFGREIMGLDTLDYRIAYVRTIAPNGNSSEELTECGLLSQNFQQPNFNYYLGSDLMNSEITNFICYGGYSLENLLAFLKNTLADEDYAKIQEFLIKLFISDAFTHHEDRNYNNLCFKIPKIPGVDYHERLRPEILVKYPNTQSFLATNSRSFTVLKAFSSAKVYDNERILGTNHNSSSYHPNAIWCPSLPYSENLAFASPEEAEAKAQEYDGFDPNLLSLFIDYTDICLPLFERLAYDDEYRKILEIFANSNSQIILTSKEREDISQIFEDKRKTFQKILKY